MREKIARRLLSHLERHTPAFVAALEIQVLLNLTAKAFGRRPVRVWNRPGEALARYAEFTQSCLESPMADPWKLYGVMYKAGQRLCRLAGFKDREDRARLVFYLYRNIGITMSGSLPGQVQVSSCQFSACYDPEACRMMSNMDEGLIAGICGSGTLVFETRITEGCPACRACFSKEGNENEQT